MNADAAVYRTLVESTHAIPWKIDWKTQRFSYVGPQIVTLLGWPQESWGTIQDWVDRIHPEDRERVIEFCVSQSQAGADHEADYRALRTGGGYVWLRDVVHVVRQPDGSPEALVGFMFDISERKRTEEKLLALQKDLEELSFKDGLTGVGNRRRFDLLFSVEWDAALRTRRPISLLLVDIDHFKQYNDRHGHIQGDRCLKRVAEILQAAAIRPRDFVARYGGEEFVLVLPETDEAGAVSVAARCQATLTAAGIVHGNSSVSEHVTISIGAGTAVPADEKKLAFVECVDKRLYRAKQSGRSRLVAE